MLSPRLVLAATVFFFVALHLGSGYRGHGDPPEGVPVFGRFNAIIMMSASDDLSR